jgi:alkylated DNA repair dioxygenase AlkB/SAM-dependent methyltransferase
MRIVTKDKTDFFSRLIRTGIQGSIDTGTTSAATGFFGETNPVYAKFQLMARNGAVLAIGAPGYGGNDSSNTTVNFRSVFPHEPLPPPDHGGFLHLQGSFTPKLADPSDKADDLKIASREQEKINDEAEPDLVSLVVSAEFWILNRQTFQLLLLLQFRALSLSLSCAQPLQLCILDPIPPFTKLRLQYTSSRMAQNCMRCYRQKNLSPKLLLCMALPDHANFQSCTEQEYNAALSLQSMLLREWNVNSTVRINDRLIQITEVTDHPLLSRQTGIQVKNDIENCINSGDANAVARICWTRSNPPKFRRLIARPYEDVSLIEQERQTSRFIVVTNLIPSTAVDADGNGSANSDHPSAVSIQLSVWEQHPRSVAHAIRSVFSKFDTSGYGIEVFVPSQVNKRSRYCHIGMRSAADAQAAVLALQERIVCWSWICGSDENTRDAETSLVVSSGNLFLDYAAITQRSLVSKGGHDDSLKLNGFDSLLGHPSRPQCTTSTDHIQIPGLALVQDFLSVDEEAALLAVLTGPQAPWAPSQKTASHTDGVVRRLVQHYGYVFDYQTANVLRDRSTPAGNCPPMPAIARVVDKSHLEGYILKCVEEGRGWDVLAGVIERTRQFDFSYQESNVDSPNGFMTASFPFLNQLTVNHYNPGEGIGSHVDTASAFSDGLISISLNSGIVMEFRNVHDTKLKKLVYLPPRSMLLMSKDARYHWEHMIVTRMTDTHNGAVLSRKLRVSLTLRTALSEDGKSHLPLVESDIYPPVWGESSLLNQLSTPPCERDHVHKVYNAIATQWHHTRGKRGVLWPGATQFLQRLAPGSIIADVGCGDGKYFPPIWEAGSFVIGTDISEPLLLTAMNDGREGDDVVPENCRVSDHRQYLRDRPAVIVADCMNLPLRTNSCDGAICIAVLHHLSTHARRVRCIEELVRIVKPGGLVNVQAWAMEQEEGSRRKFASNDVFVPFNAQPKYLKLNVSDGDSCSSSLDRVECNQASNVKSTAQVYSEALNAEFDEGKGLVVFKRYCHLYRLGELDQIASEVSGAHLLETAFESGNYSIVFEVRK